MYRHRPLRASKSDNNPAARRDSTVHMNSLYLGSSEISYLTRKFRYSDSPTGTAEVNRHGDDYRKLLGRQNPPIPSHPSVTCNHAPALPLPAENAAPVELGQMCKPEAPVRLVRVSAGSDYAVRSSAMKRSKSSDGWLAAHTM